MNNPVIEWNASISAGSGAAPAQATHEVINQSGPIAAYNAYTDDAVIEGIVERAGVLWARERLVNYGAVIGSERMAILARQANRSLPELKTFDRFGNRIDEVEFHPAYHECMSLIFGHEVHSLAWKEPRKGAHLVRGILSYLANQGEQGVCCPMGMTFAGIPAVRAMPELGAAWEEKLLSNRYDARPLPMSQKTGVTLGMAMTENKGVLICARRKPARRPQERAPAPDRNTDHWAQVVHIGADERCLSYPGADGERRVVLLFSTLVFRRQPQSHADSAPQR